MRIELLRQCWEHWADLGSSLTTDEWRTATRLDGWDVAAVYAHHGGWPVALAFTAAAVVDEPGDAAVGAADLLSRFNAPGGAAFAFADVIADGARQQAERASPAELVAPFGSVAADALDAAAVLDPETVVDYLGVARMPIDEAVRIGLLEAVVHYLDVVAALGRECDLPDAAVRDVVGLLASMAPAVAFVEAATGRRGSDQPVLPVLR